MSRFWLMAAILTGSMTLSTPAVRGQTILEKLEQRLKGLTGSEPTRPPEAEAPYLGLVGDNHAQGVVILSVAAGGPAHRVGLKRGDVITSVAGREVKGVDAFAEAMSKLRPGDKAAFRVLREGLALNTNVQIGRHPNVATLPPPRTINPATPAEQRPSLGVVVVQVSDTLRVRHGLVVRRGAVITAVRTGSPAAAARLKVGQAIVAINGRRVDSPDDLIAELRSMKVNAEAELTFYEGATLQRRRVVLTAAAPAAPVRPNLEDRLSGGGRRPALGALGRMLDDVVGGDSPLPPPAAADAPIRPLAPAGVELEALKTQVRALQDMVQSLQARIEQLERRASKAPEAKAGASKAGEAKAGEATAGEAKAGEAKAGASKAGEAKAGEAKAGEAKAGEAKAGDANGANKKDSVEAKAGAAKTGAAKQERPAAEKKPSSRVSA